MFALLGLEIKLSGSQIEYAQDDVISLFDTEEEAREAMEFRIKENLDYGYFDKIKSRNENNAVLTNSGSYTKIYRIVVPKRGI